MLPHCEMLNQTGTGMANLFNVQLNKGIGQKDKANMDSNYQQHTDS